jgi:hypothetical protein
MRNKADYRLALTDLENVKTAQTWVASAGQNSVTWYTARLSE